MTTRTERLELWSDRLNALLQRRCVLCPMGVLQGLLGPLGLLVGWLPTMLLALFAAPVIALLGALAVAYGVVVLAVAGAIVWLA